MYSVDKRYFSIFNRNKSDGEFRGVNILQIRIGSPISVGLIFLHSLYRIISNVFFASCNTHPITAAVRHPLHTTHTHTHTRTPFYRIGRARVCFLLFSIIHITTFAVLVRITFQFSIRIHRFRSVSFVLRQHLFQLQYNFLSLRSSFFTRFFLKK